MSCLPFPFPALCSFAHILACSVLRSDIKERSTVARLFPRLRACFNFSIIVTRNGSAFIIKPIISGNSMAQLPHLPSPSPWQELTNHSQQSALEGIFQFRNRVRSNPAKHPQESHERRLHTSLRRTCKYLNHCLTTAIPPTSAATPGLRYQADLMDRCHEELRPSAPRHRSRSKCPMAQRRQHSNPHQSLSIRQLLSPSRAPRLPTRRETNCLFSLPGSLARCHRHRELEQWRAIKPSRRLPAPYSRGARTSLRSLRSNSEG